jgi:hypothetical protein
MLYFVERSRIFETALEYLIHHLLRCFWVGTSWVGSDRNDGPAADTILEGNSMQAT